MTLQFDGWPIKCYGTSSIPHQALCTISNLSVNSNWSYIPEALNSGQNRRFSVPCELEIWQMTLTNSRAPPLCCLKLCETFNSHQWILTGITARKRPILVKIDVSCPVWPWNLADNPEKTIGHLFYATLSFVHHFKAIGEFQLKLQSGTLNSGQNRRFFVPCDVNIRRMALKNSRPPLPCCFRLQCIIPQPSVNYNWCYSPETSNLYQKRLFLSSMTLKFDRWLWKTIEHRFFATSSYVHHFVAIGEFKLSVRKRPIWVKIDDF